MSLIVSFAVIQILGNRSTHSSLKLLASFGPARTVLGTNQPHCRSTVGGTSSVEVVTSQWGIADHYGRQEASRDSHFLPLQVQAS